MLLNRRDTFKEQWSSVLETGLAPVRCILTASAMSSTVNSPASRLMRFPTHLPMPHQCAHAFDRHTRIIFLLNTAKPKRKRQQ